MPEAPQTTIQGRRVRPGFFRELLAVAETKEQVEQFVGLAAAVRQVQVERAERTWKLGGWLSEQLPMERILRAFGVRVDGSIHGLDEEELLRRPIAVLLLPDVHPIHGALHGEAAIRAALEWARDPAGKEAAEEIRGAYSAYRAEQRFLASSLADDPLHYRRSSISLAELIHALHQIFDPRILESPITGIGLTGMGAVKRLAGALAYVHRAAERAVDAWSLGDIPKREDALLDAPGYGGTTHSRLAAAMLAYAREWRHVRAGVAATTAAPGVSAAQGKKALREGLDELAALFD